MRQDINTGGGGGSRERRQMHMVGINPSMLFVLRHSPFYALKL